MTSKCIKLRSGDSFGDLFDNFHEETNTIITSNIPDICKEEPCILGVDEAGRGPVLGPMVYGIAFCPLKKCDEFSSIGCADSKVLSEKKREEIFAVLRACDDYIGWSVDIISPNFISNKMLKRKKYSLNEIAQDSTVNLIQEIINAGVQVAEIYVDTVGPAEKYQERLSKFFPECTVTVAKKADSLYPIVSAASICAKVSRDKAITNWKFPENIEANNLGSGYPADPETKSFLSDHLDGVFGFPNLVRFSWSTASKLLENSALPVEWEEECEKDAINISSYFNNIGQNKHAMKHNFFKDSNLSNITFF